MAFYKFSFLPMEIEPQSLRTPLKASLYAELNSTYSIVHDECHFVLWIVKKGNSLEHLREEGRGTFNEDSKQYHWPLVSLFRQLLSPLSAHHTTLSRVPRTGTVVAQVV